MLCYQCEQTQRHDDKFGCISSEGACGKDANTSDLQDILIYQVKGIAQYAHRARTLGVVDRDLDAFILFALFTTLTNVNFTPARFQQLIQEAAQKRDAIKIRYEVAASEKGVEAEILSGAAAWQPPKAINELLAQASIAAVNAEQETVGEDVIGLRVLILYGLKGIAAYAHHARMLGKQDDSVDAEIERLLDYLASNPTDLEELLAQALEAGKVNLKVMALLDAANTDNFGQQTIGQARTSPVAGKAILVSGHDLHDLANLLEQTKDSGINIYTHGEMLPAHAYPKLKAYAHLVGNYGSAWQNQQQEFADFPGPILMTSNCIIEPAKNYRQRIFTIGPVGWPGVRHIQNDNYAPLIQAAKALPGFKEDSAEKTVTIGFGRHSVLGVADQVVEAVKTGAIKHFFLIGGCDGAVPGRNYYTELADNAPSDSVILTLGCGKYRFNDHEFGNIGGIPRLLDVGQCNDAYSAIQIASTLAEAFECGVNDLPLSLMVSWFEQKATAVLLSLLALEIKGIHLGPTLPGYLTPNLLAILIERFDIKVNQTAEADLQAALGQAA